MPFGVPVTLLWPSFGADPFKKITFMSAPYFPDHFLKTTLGGKLPNLPGALDVPFGATVLWPTFVAAQ